MNLPLEFTTIWRSRPYDRHPDLGFAGAKGSNDPIASQHE
jgi:hypothetical protein